MPAPAQPGTIELIVGLGNPGPQYEATRHNAGFLVVDAFAQELGVTYWKQQAGALVATALYRGRQIVLAKPQSYMNTSGGPTKKLMDAYGVPIENVLVIHDELDIPEGTARVKFGGGHAGHNGLRSIADKTGSRDFTRVRVGIGRPPGRMQVSDYVLQEPRGEARELFGIAVAKGLDCVTAILDRGVADAMNVCNQK